MHVAVAHPERVSGLVLFATLGAVPDGGITELNETLVARLTAEERGRLEGLLSGRSGYDDDPSLMSEIHADALAVILAGHRQRRAPGRSRWPSRSPTATDRLDPRPGGRDARTWPAGLDVPALLGPGRRRAMPSGRLPMQQRSSAVVDHQDRRGRGRRPVGRGPRGRPRVVGETSSGQSEADQAPGHQAGGGRGGRGPGVRRRFAPAPSTARATQTRGCAAGPGPGSRAGSASGAGPRHPGRASVDRAAPEPGAGHPRGDDPRRGGSDLYECVESRVRRHPRSLVAERRVARCPELARPASRSPASKSGHRGFDTQCSPRRCARRDATRQDRAELRDRRASRRRRRAASGPRLAAARAATARSKSARRALYSEVPGARHARVDDHEAGARRGSGTA